MRPVLLSLAAAVTLAMPAMPAGAQSPGLARFEPRTRAAVEAIIDSAVAAGLPRGLTQSLVTEAQRLRARGASPDAILARVRTQSQHLQIARLVLGDSKVDVESGAAALSAGVRPETLVELRRARPDSSVAVALVVLADLITRGVPPDTASAMILAIAGTPAGDQVFHELRSAVALDITSGKTPVYAAEARTRGVLGPAGTAAITTQDTRGAPSSLGGGRPAGPPPPRP